jgi:hypothetical protein
MMCQICQTDNHLFLFKGKECCNACYDKFFEKTRLEGIGYSFSDSKLHALWINCFDENNKPFMVVFDYLEKTTTFVRAGTAACVLHVVKPATDEFLQKASKHIKQWQVFS